MRLISFPRALCFTDFPSIRRASKDNRHQFPCTTSFNFSFVFDDHVLLCTKQQIDQPYTVALNLGSGTRDTLRTRSRAHAKHLFSIRFTRSQLSHLFPLSLSLVYLPATSSQLPHSPRRVASKNLTLRRVSLSPFPLLCCRNAWSSVLREAQARPRFAAFTFTTFVSFVSSSHRYHAIPTTSDLVFPA